jgi:5-carboxymethyl-2-hydroxymuconate isomerase/acylpyruvate hydrolase
MRLITFTRSGSNHLEIGARILNHSGDQILPFADVVKKLSITNFPCDMRSFLRAGSSVMDQAKSWVAAVADHSALLIAAKKITYLTQLPMLKSFCVLEKITVLT